MKTVLCPAGSARSVQRMISLTRTVKSALLAHSIVTKGQTGGIPRGSSPQAICHRRGIVSTEAVSIQSSMTVTSPVSGLQPANVWDFFEQLTKIPRPSKHEEKCELSTYDLTSARLVHWECIAGSLLSKVLVRRVLQFLKDFANERKLAWQQDAVGNMVIKRTGTGGGEMAPAVVIQVLALLGYATGAASYSW